MLFNVLSDLWVILRDRISQVIAEIDQEELRLAVHHGTVSLMTSPCTILYNFNKLLKTHFFVRRMLMLHNCLLFTLYTFYSRWESVVCVNMPLLSTTLIGKRFGERGRCIRAFAAVNYKSTLSYYFMKYSST